jgi:AcrR family transcriptional regulator
MTATSKSTTRDRLVDAASLLFRQKGYHGTGLSEILQAASAPKGSLYHHFPNGKSNLAQAGDGMLRIIEDAFVTASDYQNGVTTLCHKLAKLFDIAPDWATCPISGILFDGQSNTAFRDLAKDIFQSWMEAIAGHARRLGLAPDTAQNQAELLFTLIQGSWTLARARNASDALRTLPMRLGYGA